MSTDVAVVGGGLAGLRTAESLRAAGYDGRIRIFSTETHLPYTRPPLSKRMLTDGPPHEALAFPIRDALADVTWDLGTTIEAADLDARTLSTGEGETIGFDALVIASGVRARRLPVPGPQAGRHVLRTLADAEAIAAHLTPGSRVVTVGAGFIGCELAATAQAVGCEATLVAADPEAMVRPLQSEVGAAIRRRHEDRGLRFHLSAGIARYLGDDRVTGVELADGTKIDADVLIEAVGSQCNTEWLAGNGLDLADGVRTDATLRVDHATPVVAVGDVARYPHTLFDDTPRRIEHWQLATETGRVAARSLLHALDPSAPEPAALTALPYFWSDQGDIHLQSFGAPGLGDRIEVLEGSLEEDAAIGYFAGERLVAVVLIGLKSRMPYYRKLVLDSLSG